MVRKRQDSATGPIIAEYLFDATSQKGLLSRSKAFTAQGSVEVCNVTYDARMGIYFDGDENTGVATREYGPFASTGAVRGLDAWVQSICAWHKRPSLRYDHLHRWNPGKL